MGYVNAMYGASPVVVDSKSKTPASFVNELVKVVVAGNKCNTRDERQEKKNNKGRMSEKRSRIQPS